MYTLDFKKPIKVHFMGIGGISMSGLAEILLKENFTITGSDMKKSELCSHLEGLGATIYYPQAADNIKEDIDLIVYTAAIRDDNPEMIAAKASNKPMITRAELLGQIMANYENSIAISGTHGKTTTTSMISSILLQTKDDPTITVGAILENIGSNVHVGNSSYFVAEACEYTNSFHSFFPKYNIILNVDADHLDFFKNLDNIRASFKKFAGNTKDNGILVINKEIPDFQFFTADLSCQIITYSITDNSADIYADDIAYENGCGIFSPVYKGKKYDEIRLAVPGTHNIGNALSVIALMIEMGVDYQCIKAGFMAFHGANRRFQVKGTYKGATIVDDYAHHPTEISASLAAARNFDLNRLVVVFQPHTYTRTLSLMDEFVDALSAADVIIMPDIYPAREPDIYNVSSKDVVEKLKNKGKEAYYLGSFEDTEKFIEKNIMNRDLLITMGAGDVNIIGENLLAK